MRIDVETGNPATYTIPPSNPYANIANARGEIWALGLRNPWSSSFDRRTGDFYIADVGEGTREEVNFQPAGSPGGADYGWNIMEGSLCFNYPYRPATNLRSHRPYTPRHEEWITHLAATSPAAQFTVLPSIQALGNLFLRGLVQRPSLGSPATKWRVAKRSFIRYDPVNYRLRRRRERPVVDKRLQRRSCLPHCRGAPGDDRFISDSKRFG